MIPEALLDTIRTAAENGDLTALSAWFAEEVELSVTTSVGSSASDSRRGKQSVLEYLERLCEQQTRSDERPHDFLVSGERVVAFRDQCFALTLGLVVRSESALVFDMRDGSIVRLAIHHELSPVATTLRAHVARSADAVDRTAFAN